MIIHLRVILIITMKASNGISLTYTIKIFIPTIISFRIMIVLTANNGDNDSGNDSNGDHDDHDGVGRLCL